MAASAIDIYRREIGKKLEAGNATEHTHRSAMEALIESLASGLTATNEPKRVECGAPDFVISRKAAHGPVTIGYIEAKDVGKPLDEIERAEQMRRYLPALSNLVLTDYLEFRWYVEGERRLAARLARVGKADKLVPEEDGAKAVSDLLAAFLSHEAEPIATAKELALRMARLTHFIRDMIVTAFEKHSASATLRDLHDAFEKALLPELPIPQFADMFAQTLAYGLFAARVSHRGPRGSFRRLGAAAEIPKTNPFLRQLFETITGTALDDEPFAGFVDDLAQLLADAYMDAVLADFGRRSALQDPVVHFYETFLAAYDPKLREARGVYYTPEPVVSYIVRSVDHLLKTHFGCPNGLAEHRGTGVSPVENHGQDAQVTARVFHADLWGLREAKYDYLFENSVEKTAWKELCPRSPGYLFIPQEQSLSAEYAKGWKITDAMPVNVLGFQTHRDHFAIDLDASALRERIDDLREATKSDQELRSLYGLQDGGGWKLSAAREQVRRDKKWT